MYEILRQFVYRVSEQILLSQNLWASRDSPFRAVALQGLPRAPVRLTSYAHGYPRSVGTSPPAADGSRPQHLKKNRPAISWPAGFSVGLEGLPLPRCRASGTSSRTRSTHFVRSRVPALGRNQSACGGRFSPTTPKEKPSSHFMASRFFCGPRGTRTP